jgi:glycosyltransferase involved in cell wall biosynthesis
VTPPRAKQVGGIENAVEGLREELQRQDIKVLEGGDSGDAESVHHFHGLWDSSYSRLAARLSKCGRPYVVSPHGMLEPWAFRHRWWKKLPYFWLIERKFLTGARALFVTSRMEAEHLTRVFHHPCVQVLPLGCRDRRGPDYAAAREALGWQPDERRILFLSRLDVKKGLDLLLQAMAGDGQDWNGWRLIVVGDGKPAYVAALKAMAAWSSRLPPVDWVGAVWGDARWRYLQGADLFCLPTHSENFGIAVLEALHVGTPVLTTDQTPWGEHAGRDGLFIAKPEIQSIQQILLDARRRSDGNWLTSDRNELAVWSESQFAWEKLVPAYVRAYQRAMQTGHADDSLVSERIA